MFRVKKYTKYEKKVGFYAFDFVERVENLGETCMLKVVGLSMLLITWKG